MADDTVLLCICLTIAFTSVVEDVKPTYVCVCLFSSYVINELIQTEKQYVEDLAQIVLVCIVSHSISHSTGTEMLSLLIKIFTCLSFLLFTMTDDADI